MRTQMTMLERVPVSREAPLCAVIAVAFLVSRASASDGHDFAPGKTQAGDHGEPIGDVFCGPRCASYILQHYGKAADLLELVGEIQDRDWSQGSTLADIDQALRVRGLHTAALRLSPSADLRWAELAVVHLNAEGSRMGHFVVAHPTDSRADFVSVWCGLRGVRQLPTPWIRTRRSGAVLLVSDRAIANPARCVAVSRHSAWTAALLICMGILLFRSLRAWTRACRFRSNPLGRKV